MTGDIGQDVAGKGGELLIYFLIFLLFIMKCF